MIAGVVVLLVVIGVGCWWIATLMKRVETERNLRMVWQLETAQQRVRLEEAAASLKDQLLALQAVSAEQWQATRDALERRDALIEKLTVSPPAPESPAPDLPLTDRDPTEATEDATDWTDTLTFGTVGPIPIEFGRPAPGMPTAEDMQRGGT